MGAAINSETPTSQIVPSNADQMPPRRMPPTGFVVKNSQEIGVLLFSITAVVNLTADMAIRGIKRK